MGSEPIDATGAVTEDVAARRPRGALLLRHPWRGRLLLLTVLGAVVLLLSTLAPGLVSGIDERSGDLLWRWAAAQERNDERRLIIVDIDEAALARFGPWPWPRQLLAKLLHRIGELGPTAIVADIVFPDPRPDDGALAAEVARQPVVLAQIFGLPPATPTSSGRLQGALDAPACRAPLPQANGFIANAPDLKAPTGHITPRIASDGAVRALPALVCHDGQTHAALGLMALVRAAGAAPAFELHKGQGLLEPPWWLSHRELPALRVPLDRQGDVRLPYRLDRRAFVSVSATDLLEGRAPAALFSGALVLLGATAFGIGDFVPTPLGGAIGGVEVHAQFISALLDGQLPHTPVGAPALRLFWSVLAAGLLLATCVRPRRLPPVWLLPLLAAVLAGLTFGLFAWLLQTHDLWLGWADVAIFIVLSGMGLAMFEHARTRLERERLYRNLSAYLPESVAAHIAFHEVRGLIEAERREVSVLFADIRNFSAYCEGRPPEETAGLLHAFFTTATRVVEAHGGVIEEFVGDAVMAVWNGPIRCLDHSARAYAAACALLDEARSLFPDPPPPGLEPLALGIGIESGDALIGSFGPARRRTHTALGETVTVAVRITALTGELAQPILLGEKAARLLPAGACASLGCFLLEGLRRPREIHAPAASA